MKAVGRRASGVGRAVALLLFMVARPSHTQTTAQQLRQQQDSLDRVRAERDSLERRVAELRNKAHDIKEDVDVLNNRVAATARVVKGLEKQLTLLSDEVDSVGAAVNRAEKELADKRGSLQRHLVEIYKRGPLFTEQALLSARSFGDLVARYKYLHTLTLRDHALVARVEQLRGRVAVEHERLVSLQDQLERNQREKEREEARLIAERREQSAALQKVQQQQKKDEAKLAEYNRTITRMANTIAALDAARRRNEAARPATAPKVASTISTSDYGKLNWPVEGDVIYNFGQQQTSSNTTIRWNGIGIRTPFNAPVHSVAAGTVVSVGPVGLYGLTVVVDHGGGDYSIYGSLSRTDVKLNQKIAKGAAVGAAGVSDVDLPAHLHFEIRSGAKAPIAVDPVTWLKARR